MQVKTQVQTLYCDKWLQLYLWQVMLHSQRVNCNWLKSDPTQMTYHWEKQKVVVHWFSIRYSMYCEYRSSESTTFICKFWLIDWLILFSYQQYFSKLEQWLDCIVLIKLHIKVKLFKTFLYCKMYAIHIWHVFQRNPQKPRLAPVW